MDPQSSSDRQSTSAAGCTTSRSLGGSDDSEGASLLDAEFRALDAALAAAPSWADDDMPVSATPSSSSGASQWPALAAAAARQDVARSPRALTSIFRSFAEVASYGRSFGAVVRRATKGLFRAVYTVARAMLTRRVPWVSWSAAAAFLLGALGGGVIFWHLGWFEAAAAPGPIVPSHGAELPSKIDKPNRPASAGTRAGGRSSGTRGRAPARSSAPPQSTRKPR
jgi:hypothetical protein